MKRGLIEQTRPVGDEGGINNNIAITGGRDDAAFCCDVILLIIDSNT